MHPFVADCGGKSPCAFYCWVLGSRAVLDVLSTRTTPRHQVVHTFILEHTDIPPCTVVSHLQTSSSRAVWLYWQPHTQLHSVPNSGCVFLAGMAVCRWTLCSYDAVWGTMYDVW